MIVNSMTEISLYGIFDRGKANQERIVIRANETTNAGRFGIMVGVYQATTDEGGLATPIHDNLFWFGDGILNKDDWIVVYTGPGVPQHTKLSDSNEVAYVLHWGRTKTIFNTNLIVPILFSLDGVDIRKLQESELMLPSQTR